MQMQRARVNIKIQILLALVVVLAVCVSVVSAGIVLADADANGPGCPMGDLNEDCAVDSQDLQVFTAWWLRNPRCAGFGCPDLDGVGVVDMDDYALLAPNWRERWVGSLQVTISPGAAVVAGAQWRVDGGTWRNSGYKDSDVPPGLHSVDFKDISGWIKPDQQTVEIVRDQVCVTSGVYQKHAPFFGLYVSEVQVRSDSATGQDVKNRTGVEWDKPREFVENWLVGYLDVNFADVVLYQAGDGVTIKTLMFEVDNIAEDKLIDGTLNGIRGNSMDAWGGGGGPAALLAAAGENDVGVVFNIQPREMTEDQIVGVVSAAFYRFASYPGFLGMVVDCEFCDTMETGSTWRENEQLRARMLRRACGVRDHYEGVYGRDLYIFGVWYRTAEPPYGDGARPWHIYFPDVSDLDRLVPMYDGASDDIGSSTDEWLAGAATGPKNHGIEKSGHCLFFRKKIAGEWVQLDGDITLGMCEASRDAGNDFIEIEYWYHVVKGTGGWERCYGPEIKEAAESILHGPANYEASNPYPADGAIDVGVFTDLSWTPGAYATSHDVYFGPNSPPAFIQNQISTTFDPGTMTYLTTYFWRIDEVNPGGITTGTVWNFTTQPKGRFCFPADTLVRIDGAPIQISKVRPGAKVGSYGGVSVQRLESEVESIDQHEGTFECYDIVLESGKRISVVGSHQFLLDCGRWTHAEMLRPGSKLKSLNGTVSISSIATRSYSGSVYNLKVKDSDRYFVGEDALVVRDW